MTEISASDGTKLAVGSWHNRVFPDVGSSCWSAQHHQRSNPRRSKGSRQLPTQCSVRSGHYGRRPGRDCRPDLRSCPPPNRALAGWGGRFGPCRCDTCPLGCERRSIASSRPVSGPVASSGTNASRPRLVSAGVVATWPEAH